MLNCVITSEKRVNFYSNQEGHMSESNNYYEPFKNVLDILEPLDEEARNRVIKAVSALLGIDSVAQVAKAAGDNPQDVAVVTADYSQPESTFSTFAELYAAVNPTSNGEKALVAGYWLQVCEHGESFTSQEANRELANLGHRIPHITSAINTMMECKPQFILQLRKSGRSRQARKTYKLSDAGVTRVQEMISG